MGGRSGHIYIHFFTLPEEIVILIGCTDKYNEIFEFMFVLLIYTRKVLFFNRVEILEPFIHVEIHNLWIHSLRISASFKDLFMEQVFCLS